jgi:hypothetical protein
MGVAPGKNMSAKLKILLAAKFSMMLRPEKIAQEISVLRLQRWLQQKIISKYRIFFLHDCAETVFLKS